jgi:hypothetical protein
MKKMISLFKRDFNNKNCPAYNEYEDGTDWVRQGKGIATQKFDGTACLIKNGRFYKRHRVKKGYYRIPAGWVHWSFDVNRNSGHGWAPVDENNNSDKWHIKAFSPELPDGTYELCGEKIQNNPENIDGVKLLKHGSIVFKNVPVDFEGLKNWLSDKDIEGIVWHHKETGEMVKIKKSDFGMPRKP